MWSEFPVSEENRKLFTKTITISEDSEKLREDDDKILLFSNQNFPSCRNEWAHVVDNEYKVIPDNLPDDKNDASVLAVLLAIKPNFMIIDQLLEMMQSR